MCFPVPNAFVTRVVMPMPLFIGATFAAYRAGVDAEAVWYVPMNPRTVKLKYQDTCLRERHQNIPALGMMIRNKGKMYRERPQIT